MLAITLIEVGNSESPNIGTITTDARTDYAKNQQLRFKAKGALEAHFDAEVTSIIIQDELAFIDVEHSAPLDATVLLDGLNGEEKRQIELQQTWIY